MAVVAVPFILYLVRFCSPKPCNNQTGYSQGVATVQYCTVLVLVPLPQLFIPCLLYEYSYRYSTGTEKGHPTVQYCTVRYPAGPTSPPAGQPCWRCCWSYEYEYCTFCDLQRAVIRVLYSYSAVPTPCFRIPFVLVVGLLIVPY